MLERYLCQMLERYLCQNSIVKQFNERADVWKQLLSVGDYHVFLFVSFYVSDACWYKTYSLTVSSKTTTYLLILWYATFTANLPHSFSFVVVFCMKLYLLEFEKTVILNWLQWNHHVHQNKLKRFQCNPPVLWIDHSYALRVNYFALLTLRK